MDPIDPILRVGAVLRQRCATSGNTRHARTLADLAARRYAPPRMEDAAERIRDLEARLVAHGLVLKAIARLLTPATLAELRAAAQGIDDEGMQEANPDLHMRLVAQEMWSILEMVG
jgi:hypothetical protein